MANIAVRTLESLRRGTVRQKLVVRRAMLRQFVWQRRRKLLRQRHGNGKRDGVEHWQRNHLGHGIRNG